MENIDTEDEATIYSLPHGVVAHALNSLGPRDLASASCVCRLWRGIVSVDSNNVWRSFYLSRWQQPGLPSTHNNLAPAAPSSTPPSAPCAPADTCRGPRQSEPPPPTTLPAHIPPARSARPRSITTSSDCTTRGTCMAGTTPTSTPTNLHGDPSCMQWQSEYGVKMLRLRSWAGRYTADQLVGHKAAVRAARLLPSHNLMATASLDRTVRLWDLAAGLPLAASRPHGGTVRCLALDTSLLASGCSDAAVRVWHPTRGNGPNRSNGDGGRPALLYDVASQPYVLRGHTGPVSCLALGSSGLYDSDGCDSTASTPRSTGSSGAYGGGLFHRRRKQGGGWGYGNGIGSGSSSSSMIFSGSWDCTVRIWRRSADLDGGHWGEGGREEGNGDEGGEQEEQERAGGNPAHRLSSSVGSAASSASSLAAGLTINGLSPSSSGSLASGVSSGSGSGSSGDELAAGLGGPGGGLRRGGRTKKRDESGGWGCTGVLQYSDWVYCCVARGANLLVAAGSEVVVTDACTGRCVRRFAALHEAGSVAAVEGTRNGRLLFTASADGLVLAHDLRMKQGSRVLWHHNAAVTGLALEDPWLASSAADGCIILQDVEAALSCGGPGPGCSPGGRALSARCRALHCPMGAPALCLDLQDEWLAAGTESGVVRLWDFTGAAAAAERAAVSRAARTSARAARAARQGHSQHHPHHDHHHSHGVQAALAAPQQQQQQQPCLGAVSRGWGSSGSALPGLGVFGGSPSAGRAAAAPGPVSPAPVAAAASATAVRDGAALAHVVRPPATAAEPAGGSGGSAATSSSKEQEVGSQPAAQRAPPPPPPQQRPVHRARNSQRSGGAVAPPPPPPQLPPAFRYVSTVGNAGQGAVGAGPGAGGQRQLRHLGRQRTGGAVGAGGSGSGAQQQQQQRPAEVNQAVQPGPGVGIMPGGRGSPMAELVPAAPGVAQEAACGGEAEGGRQRNGGPGGGWSQRSGRGRGKGGGSGRKGEQRRVAAVAAVVE